jgi:UDP-N-acetylmuramoylalanine--D-glutamate ligase
VHYSSDRAVYSEYAILGGMEEYASYFRDKKITVLGLGLLGRGVGDVAFLHECGAHLIVTDKKSKEELQSSLDVLDEFTDITYVLGEHRMEDFEGRDMILVAPSVPLDSPYVAHAREQGTGIVQSAALFALLSKIPVIGVTGTRGKSTVTHMIHHALSEITGEKILLGGNVRGVSNLQLLKEVKEDSLAVLELDSWQLQGFGWAQISPQIAVFTNFMEDHLNYYGGSGKSHDEAMDAYFRDKAQIFLHQHEGDTLITTPDVFSRIKTLCQGDTLTQEVVLVDESTLPEEFLVPVPGEHNRKNAALALEALKAMGLTEDEALAGLATFRGVEGRLEYMGDINGVRIYNDNNATTPFATETGLRAVAQGKNVILIAGGAYKEVDPSSLIDPIEQYCKKVVLLAGTGTDRLKDKIVCEVCTSIDDAVKAALASSVSGDVLLFSPGFASFGMFKNEYDRNDQFVKLINAYEDQ